jgi:hypothetical protein
MRPYKLTYYIYSTAHALGTCTEHVTSSEDTRDVTLKPILFNSPNLKEYRTVLLATSMLLGTT